MSIATLKIKKNTIVKKKIALVGFPNLSRISPLISFGLKIGRPSGCYEQAMMLPPLMITNATPSILGTNFSFKIKGENIALKIIVKHAVDDIKMMFPRLKANPLKVIDPIININPR